jgi:hypothetical protein
MYVCFSSTLSLYPTNSYILYVLFTFCLVHSFLLFFSCMLVVVMWGRTYTRRRRARDVRRAAERVECVASEAHGMASTSG